MISIIEGYKCWYVFVVMLNGYSGKTNHKTLEEATQWAATLERL